MYISNVRISQAFVFLPDFYVRVSIWRVSVSFFRPPSFSPAAQRAVRTSLLSLLHGAPFLLCITPSAFFSGRQHCRCRFPLSFAQNGPMREVLSSSTYRQGTCFFFRCFNLLGSHAVGKQVAHLGQTPQTYMFFTFLSMEWNAEAQLKGATPSHPCPMPHKPVILAEWRSWRMRSALSLRGDSVAQRGQHGHVKWCMCGKHKN